MGRTVVARREARRAIGARCGLAPISVALTAAFASCADERVFDLAQVPEISPDAGSDLGAANDATGEDGSPGDASRRDAPARPPARYEIDGARLIATSGFESPVARRDTGTRWELSGSDRPLSSWAHEWGALPLGFSFHVTKGGDGFRSTARLVTDPSGADNQVLMTEVEALDGSPSSSRANGVFSAPEREGAARFEAHYFTLRIWMPAGWASLGEAEEPGWLSLLAFWSPEIGPGEGADDWATKSEAGRFLLSLNLEADPSSETGYRWLLRGRDMWHDRADASDPLGTNEWSAVNSAVAPPFESWFRLEIFVRKGPEARSGDDATSRVSIRMLAPGTQTWQTLFDKRGARVQHTTLPGAGFTQIVPMRNAHGSGLFRHLRSGGHRAAFYYDEIEYWVGDEVSAP